MWVAGRRFNALTPAEVVDLIAAMYTALLAEAEGDDQRYRDGAAPDGRGRFTRSLTAVESLEVREALDAGGTSARKLARHFGVSKATVYRVSGPLVLPR